MDSPGKMSSCEPEGPNSVHTSEGAVSRLGMESKRL